jgi:hypothetical protein
MQPNKSHLMCQACGKAGHTENTCDFLAMSVFLQHYLKTGIAMKATIKDAERHWVEQWKNRGGTLATTPLKVYQAYTEEYGIDLDQLEDKINWLCWPVKSQDK